MAFLAGRPHHVRKRAALGITIGVAVVLVVLMVLIYTRPKGTGDTRAESTLGDFYNTISTTTQSYVGSK